MNKITVTTPRGTWVWRRNVCNPQKILCRTKVKVTNRCDYIKSFLALVAGKSDKCIAFSVWFSIDYPNEMKTGSGGDGDGDGGDGRNKAIRTHLMKDRQFFILFYGTHHRNSTMMCGGSDLIVSNSPLSNPRKPEWTMQRKQEMKPTMTTVGPEKSPSKVKHIYAYTQFS